MTITLLGAVGVDDGRSRPSPRDRVVLAALSIRPGQVVTAAELTDALWGDAPPASAAKVVQGCVVRLRRALGAAAIETVHEGYRLAIPAEEIDVCRFERLAARARELSDLGEHDRAVVAGRAALDTWNDPALRDLDGWPSGRVEAARLASLRLDTEDLVLESSLAGADVRGVLAEAESRVAEQPGRERRWEVLALAQYRSGRQGDALRTLTRAARALRDAFGVEPGPDLRALELAILRQDPALGNAADVPLDEGSCPYPGLLAYGVEDADVFFGRDADVAHCLRVLERTGVVAVVGPSGSGKSSLLRAGLAAVLTRAGRQVDIMCPGEHPTRSLPPVRGGEGETRPCLIVDQCEEAITRCRDVYERAAFFAALAERATDGSLVLAVRADYLGELSADRRFARVAERGLHLLGPMGGEDLAAAIEGPARQVGLRFEPGLVDLLHHEVEGSAGSLPLLAHALRETWEHREGRTLTVAGYRRAGGIRGAVALTAEAIYEATEESHRPMLRDLLLRLVAPGPLGAPHRVRVPYASVARGPLRAALVERLVAARLVALDGNGVELAHESLATAWPRLRSWIDDDIDGLRTRRHLAVAAEDWERLGRPASELYRGVRLSRAVEWVQRARPDLVPTERAFLAQAEELVASERRDALDRLRDEARANRRLRALVAGVAILLAVSIVAGGLAIRQAGRADRAATAADARRAGAQALATPAVDRSLLLAAEAVRLDDSPQTRASLLAAIARDPLLASSVRVSQPLAAVAASPDGRFVAVGGPTDGVALIDASTMDLVDQIAVPALRLRFSPDSGTLAIVTDGRGVGQAATAPGIVLADVDDGSRVRLGGGPDDVPTDVAYAAADRVVATYGHRLPDRPLASLLAVWDPSRPDAPLAAVTIGGDRPTLALAPDGRTAYVGTVLTGQDGWVNVVDLAAGAITDQRDLGLRPVAVSPDGSVVAAIEGSDAVLLDAATLDERLRLETRAALVEDAWFTPDGRRLVTAGTDGSATLWDARPSLGARPDGGLLERQVVTLAGHAGRVADVAASPDGRSLYTVSVDQTMLAWDLAGDRRFVARAAGPSQAADESGEPSVRETVDGMVVYAAGTRLPTGGPVPVSGDVRWAFASADARIGAVLVADRRILLVDFETSTVTGEVVSDWTPDWAAFSPDAERLAVTGPDGEVGLIDVDAARWMAPPLLSHHGRARAVAWSDDGSMFVTGGDDGRVGLWDGRTGSEVGMLDVAVGTERATPVFDGDDVVVRVAGEQYRFTTRLDGWRAFACAVAGPRPHLGRVVGRLRPRAVPRDLHVLSGRTLTGSGSRRLRTRGRATCG